MLGNTTTTDLTNDVTDYEVDVKTTDGNYSQKENKWTNPNASKYYGFYYGVGEYRAAINAFATWVFGQGYDTDARTQVTLENITGWGEDTFHSIIWNMICVKKFNGDAYAEQIRNDQGTLINLKSLDPRRMAHITNQKGQITIYQYQQADGKLKDFKPTEILHFCNDRILDEPHGTAVTSAVEWAITKIQEARQDFARMLHTSSVRIFFVDEQDTARQTTLKTTYADAIKNKEVMIITCKPEEASFKDLEAPNASNWITWLNYLEDKFYKQLGVSKSVISGTAENTEAAAKMDRANTDPTWTREIKELEADLWNQLAIKIKIKKTPDIMQNVQADEAANTGQTKLEFQGSQ